MDFHLQVAPDNPVSHLSNRPTLKFQYGLESSFLCANPCLVTDPFEKHWQQFIEEFLQHSSCPPSLRKAMLYSLLAPGKRIRPSFLLASAELFNLKFEAVFYAAASLEMIHCFSLIHDDLPCLDNDDFRRGKPSNHKVFGEAMALLAGDAIFAAAFETLLKTKTENTSGLLKSVKRLAQVSGPIGVVGGQVLEMDMMNPKLVNLESQAILEQMHAQKTGALFEAALLIPLDLVNHEVDQKKYISLHHLAKTIGLAFQALDDLEDFPEDQVRSKTSDTTPKNNLLHYASEDSIRKKFTHNLIEAKKLVHESYGDSANTLCDLTDKMLLNRLQVNP